ncbi:unnamed protein product, partial [Adineta ricciae]
MDVLLNNQTTSYSDDPNRLWVDIDRGIRSKEPQRQFEAILKIPSLFNKQSTSTTLYSAALIQLATLFQEGSNEMRLNVTKVLDRVANRFHKSAMLDDPIKLIYSVMHSNDCIARALTLRALGKMAHVLADDVEAHLHIGHALDSNDEMEILAAVRAAKKFIPCSKTFAMSISTKLVSLIEDVTTPLTMKSWLVPLFEQMTHDVTVSMKGRQLLISLISNDATEEFLQIAVPTLAHLAVKSHIEIGETVTFFLQFLKLEPRQSCRKLILSHLVPIARCGSIVWLDSTTEDLIQYANNSDNDYVRLQVLKIIEALINGGGYISPKCAPDLKKLLQMFTIHNNIELAYQCCSTTLRIVLKYRNTSHISSTPSQNNELFSSQAVLDDLTDYLNTTLAVLLTEEIQCNHIKELQDTLNLIEQLSRAYTDSAQNFIHLLFTTRGNVENPEILTYLTKSLVRLSINHTEIITNQIVELRRLLAHTSLNDDVRYNLLALFVLSNPSDMNEIQEHINQLSLWKCFLLARWCIRHCLYKLAIELLQRLLTHVHVSAHVMWLEALIDMCRGEERLQILMNSSKNDLQILCDSLAEAGAFYESSLIQMPRKLSYDDDERSNDTQFTFERAYCSIRSSILQHFYELIHTIYQYDLGMVSFELLGKRMLTIMAKRFSTISSKINNIQQQFCSDKDTQTIWCLTFSRYLCDIIYAVIERIIRRVPLDKTIWFNRLNEMSWRDGFTEQMFIRLQHVIEFVCTRLHGKKTAKKNANIDEELAILQYLATSLISISPAIPRMFFQKLQKSNTKLTAGSSSENQDRSALESNFAMSNEIKDNEEIHSDKENSHEVSQENEQSVSIENGQIEETTTAQPTDERDHQTEIESENPELAKEATFTDVDIDKTEEENKEDNIEEHDQSTSQPPAPSEEHSSIEENTSEAVPLPEENQPAEPVQSENSSALLTAEEDSSTVTATEKNETPVVRIQSQQSNGSDDANHLLQTIADKSNKEASSAILNTLVEGDFDLDKNYIIQKPRNLTELFAVFNKMSSSLQAELLSVLIGIMRKSERNLLASVDAQIYGKVLEVLNETDDDVVADLLVDILTVLTSLTINVHELKLLLRYLKTENRVWKKHAVKLLNIFKNLPHRHGPDEFFNFPGRNGSGIVLPPIKTWPYQNGFTITTWFRIDPVANSVIEKEKPYLYWFCTSKGHGYTAHFVGNCLVISYSKLKEKAFQHCIQYEFKPREWYMISFAHQYQRWGKSSIHCYINGQLVSNAYFPWSIESGDLFDKCYIGCTPDRNDLTSFSGQLSTFYLFSIYLDA